jgi:hypothetical protein
MQLLIVIGFSLAVVALFFAGVGIKILLKKNGKFAGTCASNNPLLNKDGAPCGLCGAMPEEQCKK